MDIIIDMWASGEEGALSKWFVSNGDEVREGDLIATIAYEKTEFEVNAPAGGRIQIMIDADGAVKPGDTIARIG